MVDDAGAAEARGDGLLGFPLTPPRIRSRPWWFPVQELRNPLVFSLEAWLADSIFGPDRAVVPEMEWMSQALLTVDAVHAGKLVEITVFGRPAVQRRVKSVLLSLASGHREQRARGEGHGKRHQHLEMTAALSWPFQFSPSRQQLPELGSLCLQRYDAPTREAR
ncbi:hypothetical protein EI555_010935 [Monodon monoceros]|uniref:KH-like RNA-binding domain-containing protein n=1 Tax=Monodon monoceros TaxID=40151 RepID=A0A4U1F7A3_MONMO|nr:hypothetical protein EI555_010935 [Monodon monoceros]